MSYNSNGYIMLDFSMLDFSRTNQIIDGIYQRVFEIIGTNKFVLILNAQSKTPLPACVSFINSSYVIESFLYNFAITIDDNVRIENVSSDIIKDGIISAGTTWSSSKIKDELDSKVNTSSLSEVATTGSYNDLLDTPDIPVDINDLDNVLITTPVNGNVLVFNGSDWVNSNINADDIEYTTGVSVGDKLDIIGTISKSNWIANQSNANGTVLTDTLVLNKGTYIIQIKAPNADNDISLIIRNADTYEELFVSKLSSLTDSILFINFSGTIRIQAVAAQSALVNFSNLGRGCLSAIRIS